MADVTIGKNKQGWRVRAARYQAQIVAEPEPAIHVYREGWRLMRLPAVSGLATADAAENLTDIRIDSPVETEEGIRLVLTAQSSLWQERRFTWEFHADSITYRHEANGPARPGRCYFFSNAAAGAVVEAVETYSPAANLADEFRRRIAVPQSLGIFPETPYSSGGFIADRVAEVFAPHGITGRSSAVGPNR